MAFYVIVILYFVFTRHEVENVALPDCKDGRLSLREFEYDSVRCQHDRFQKVTWTISSPDNNAQIFSGSCPTLGAPCRTYSDIILTREDESSDLTIVANYRKYGNTIVTCKTGSAYSCQIRIVHPANQSDCHINMNDSTLSGYCHVTQLYSSNNVYTCQWNIRYTAEGAFRKMPSILFAYQQRGQPYYTGMCGFSFSRPVDGEIYLSLTVDPGLQDTHIANITIPNQQVPDAQLPFLPVTVDGTETLSLMCVISPETTRPYAWSGVQCNEGNRNTTCTFTPGNIHTENAVTCLGNFSLSSYNGLTLEARFDFNNATPTHTTDQTITGQHTTKPPEVTTRPTTTGSDSGNSPSGDSTPPETTITHTGSRTAGTGQSESTPAAAIGGGVGAAVVVIIVVIIIVVLVVRRRKGPKGSTENEPEDNDEFIEHDNILYEPGDSPYVVNEAYQPESTVQKQPAMTTVDPTYEDHNLDSYDDGYAAVSAGSPQENGKVSHTNPQPSLDHDLYSSVDAPAPVIPTEVSGPATQGDEYAVVDKSRKRNTEPTFQPDVYAQVNKSRPKTGGDVYAQVNKPAKRANSSPMQHDLVEGDGNYADVQKPKPDLKPKPVLKPKPTAAVKPNPKSTSGSVETSDVDDEYNVLRFQGRNSDTPANPDAGQLYSHIGSEI